MHRHQPEKYKQNVDVALLEKLLRMPIERRDSSESMPVTAIRNTAKRSFSKLRVIKTFHRSTMTDEKLTNLAMISIESETAKICDMFELTKTFVILKTWKSHYTSLKHSKCLRLSALYVVMML